MIISRIFLGKRNGKNYFDKTLGMRESSKTHVQVTVSPFHPDSEVHRLGKGKASLCRVSVKKVQDQDRITRNRPAQPEAALLIGPAPHA